MRRRRDRLHSHHTRATLKIRQELLCLRMCLGLLVFEQYDGTVIPFLCIVPEGALCDNRPAILCNVYCRLICMDHPAHHGLALKQCVITGEGLLKTEERHGVCIYFAVMIPDRRHGVARLPSNRGMGWSARMIFPQLLHLYEWIICLSISN